MLTTKETTNNQIVFAPRIAIVIPVFKHSVLVAEAITCALEQDTKFPYVIIIVNDGCKFKETDRVGRDFALAYPEQVIYLYRPNGGLSAARNTGIDFALDTWDSVEAIYLLDADNRISPQTIERSFQVLLSEPEAGWVYPNVNMFGQESYGDYAGEYSVLRHLRCNTCEAGSLIRREVFDAGCRYDESMKLGFEDWEFWWQAIDAGYRGKHLPEFGFQYRKRFESMLKNSERDSQSIINYMHRKHRHLFTHSKIVSVEHEEVPRYGIFLSDTGQIILTSDPAILNHSISLDQFREIYHRAESMPARYHRPYFLAFTRTAVLNFLKEHGLLRWVFWRLERAQNVANFANLIVDVNLDQSAITIHENESGLNAKAGETDHLVMTTISTMDKCLDDPLEDWIQSLLKSKPMPNVFNLRLEIPDNRTREILGSGALYPLLSIFKDLRGSMISRREKKTWDWHTKAFPPRSLMFEDARLALQSGPIYPFLTQESQRHIGFILPLVEFGGVEKVALNIAKTFKEAGWVVHLFVFNFRMQILPEWAKIFDTINFYYESDMHSLAESKYRYMGSTYDDWSHLGDHSTALGLLSWLNVVVNFHCNPVNSLMGLLRRAGTKTIASLHVHDITHRKLVRSHGYLMLGYEHAYDFIIACSNQMMNWCHAMGVPDDKLLVVPNACGYPLDESTIHQILTRRWQRESKRKLRVLFIGRFERQKGLDRLVRIIEASHCRQVPIQYRLVGKNLLKDDNATSELKSIADLIEAPVLSTQELNELYEWADVLLLPSYWEGLPLTILEAMRLGVVVCASDVGAVTEAIDHEKTGLVIPNLAGEAFVEAAIEILSKLVSRPDKLREISKAAATVASSRTWVQSCAEMIQCLEGLL